MIIDGMFFIISIISIVVVITPYKQGLWNVSNLLWVFGDIYKVIFLFMSLVTRNAPHVTLTITHPISLTSPPTSFSLYFLPGALAKAKPVTLLVSITLLSLSTIDGRQVAAAAAAVVVVAAADVVV